MTLLERSTLSALVGGVLLLLAPALAGGEGKVFTHEVHKIMVQECQTCHDIPAQGPPALREEACKGCHDDKDLGAWKRPPRARRMGLPFSHQSHGSLPCLDCHEVTASDSQKAGQPMERYEDCLGCHRKKAGPLAQDCKACHGQEERLQRPRSHGPTWTRTHGTTSRWKGRSGHGQGCMDCHHESSCQSCHRIQRPQSHNGLWRTRLHGTRAQWERESCLTCHETGSCQRCHATTRPLNHRGSWSSTHGLAVQTGDYRGCTVCHSMGWCETCHGGGR